MKIGIDIDDTTFLTVKSMLKYADIFEEEISGVPTNRDSFGLIKNRYYLKALYGWDEKTKFAFFNKYYKNVLEECTMLPNADKTIQKLKEEGKSIIISTHNPKVFEKLATYHLKLWLNTFSVISLIKKWE